MYGTDFEMNEAAMTALDRIKNRGVEELTESIAIAEKKSAISRERDMLEEFSVGALGSKLKTDKYIYDVMFKNLNSSEDINELIETMIQKMTAVYEALNVAPVNYRVAEDDVINMSEAENTEKAQEIVDSYMADNLFKLSKKSRIKRYKNRVTCEAQEFVEKFKVDSGKAIDFAYKSAVISDFLENVHFPKFIKLYLEECMTSETYAEFFETDVLEDAFTSYGVTLKAVSQLIATSI